MSRLILVVALLGACRAAPAPEDIEEKRLAQAGDNPRSISQPAPTLEDVKGKSPARVGEILLAGQEHGIVETVETRPPHGMDPPGSVELGLVEQAAPKGDACVRRRWSAQFLSEPGGRAPMTGADPVIEAAIPSASGCIGVRFAQAYPGTAPGDVVTALRHFAAMLAGTGQTAFSCTDATGSTLCETPASIQTELARLGFRWVERRGDEVEILLDAGQPGPVTSVRYTLSRPTEVRVERDMPPPA